MKNTIQWLFVTIILVCTNLSVSIMWLFLTVTQEAYTPIFVRLGIVTVNVTLLLIICYLLRKFWRFR